MEYDEEYKKENWIKPQEKSQSQKYKILAIFHIFFIDFSLGAHPSCGSEREAVSVEGRERHFYSVLWTFGNGTALSRSLAFIFQQSQSELSFYILFISLFCAHHSFRCISISRRFKLPHTDSERESSCSIPSFSHPNLPAIIFPPLPCAPHSHLLQSLSFVRIALPTEKK